MVGTAVLGPIAPPDADGETLFTLRYTSNKTGSPVAAEELRRDPVFDDASFLKSGPAGTVFPLSREQWKRLERRMAGPKDAEPTIALSIRQPWAELILRGIKTIEVRTVVTHKRERVLIYASKAATDVTREAAVARRYKLDLASLPRGKIVGSAEIWDCRQLAPRDSVGTLFPVPATASEFGWHMRAPLREEHPRTPQRQPQPAFFRPF